MTVHIPGWLAYGGGAVLYILIAVGAARPIAFFLMDVDLKWWGVVLAILAVLLWPVTLVVLILWAVLAAIFGPIYDLLS